MELQQSAGLVTSLIVPLSSDALWANSQEANSSDGRHIFFCRDFKLLRVSGSVNCTPFHCCLDSLT